MIKSFRSKALERFWWKGRPGRLPADQLPRLTRILTALEAATRPSDMAVPGYRFHPLTGDQQGRFSVSATANWRVTFGWSDEGPDAIDVDHEDYH